MKRDRVAARVASLLLFAAVLPAQFQLIPDTPVVTQPRPGISIQALSGRVTVSATVNGVALSGRVELVLPFPLPAGSTDSGVILFPSGANLAIRQSWIGGAPTVTLERTAIGRCSTNLDSRDCPINRLEVETTGGVRRAYHDADIQIGSTTATVRFRWEVRTQSSAVDAIRIVGSAPTAGKKLAWGNKVTFRARVRVTLLSRSRARAGLQLTDSPTGGNVLASSAAFTAISGMTGPAGEELPPVLELPEFEVPRTLGQIYLHAVLVEENAANVIARYPERYPIPEVKLSISNMEVSQVVQTADNRIPLIADRGGIVRAYVRQDPGAPLITGVNGQAILGTRLLSRIGEPTSAHLVPDRQNQGHSLNFLFDPTDAPEGTVELEVRLNEAANEEYSVEEEVKRFRLPFTVALTKDLWIDLIEVRISPPGVVNTSPISKPNAASLRRSIDRLFPASPKRILMTSRGPEPYPGGLLAGEGQTKTDEAQKRFLNWLRGKRATEYYQPDMLIAVLDESVDVGDPALLGLSDPVWLRSGKGQVGFVKMGPTASRTLAHEVGHNLGLWHPATDDSCGAKATGSNWQKFYGDGSGTIHDPGFDFPTRRIVSPDLSDLMTYCGTRWISPFHYFQLGSQFRLFSATQKFTPLSDLSNLPAGNVTKLEANAGKGAESRSAAAQKNADPADYLVVSGWVQRDGAAGGLDAAVRVKSTAPADTSEQDAPHCLDVHGSAGPAEPFCFQLSFTHPEEGRTVDRDYFTAKVALPAGLARVVLRRGGLTLAELSTGASPTLRIDAPAGGQRLEGLFEILWTASQPDGAALTYNVDISTDLAVWRNVAFATTATRLNVSASDFPAPGDYFIRVTALSGLGSTSTIVGPVSIAQAPRIEVPVRTLAFGQVEFGAFETRTLTVRATGTGPLRIREVTSSNPLFVLADSLPIDIAAGGEVELEVTFDARSAGAHSGVLRLVSDATPDEVIEVRLEAVVVAAGSGGGAGGGAGGGGTPGGGGSGTGGTGLVQIMPLTARGWPNERTFDNPPRNAVDGSTSTFTWTTNPNNTQLPSYFGADFGSSKAVSRIRLYKDNDGGGGTLSDFFKNLSIEYSTSPATTAMESRTWTRVTGLANGFLGAELLTAVSVNPDGSVIRDSHNSANNGWASLTFNAVNATGLRIAFSNVTSPSFFNHYKVHEFEAYGPPASGGAGGIGGTDILQNGSGDSVPAAGCTVPASIPGWTTDGRVGICSYNAGGGYPGPNDPGPPNRGANFFFGGSSATSAMNQVVSLASNATQIDAGSLPFTLSGYLGGYAGDGDSARVTLAFLNQSGASVGQASVIGPVTPADRAGRTGMFLRTATGNVPAGARSARVTVEFTRTAGDANDGYADDLSLVLGAGGNTGGGGTGGTGGTGGGTAGNLLCNGSFEQPGTTQNFITVARGSSQIPCWSVTAGDIDYIGNYWPASQGGFSIDLDGGVPGAVAQTFATQAGRQYTVTFDLAGHASNGIKRVRVSAAGQSEEKSFDTTGRTYQNLGWQGQTFRFTANAASTTLEIASLSTGGSFGPALDNVCAVEGTAACGSTGGTGGTGGGTTAQPLQFSFNGIDVGGRVNFLSVNVGTASTVTLAVRNPGAAAATVNSIASTNPVFTASPQSFTIDAGATRSLDVRFLPAAARAEQGVLTLNLAGGRTEVLNLSGTGLAAGGSGGGTGGGTAANLLCNGSFEQPGTTQAFITVARGSSQIPCWSVTAGDLDYIGNYWPASQGSFSIDLDGNVPGAVAQTFATQAGRQYTVTFDLAGHASNGIKRVRVSAAGQSEEKSFDTTGRTYQNLGWQGQTFRFTANAASTTLEIASLSTGGSFGPALDNVCAVEGTAACGGGTAGGGTTGAPALQFSLNGIDAGGRVNFLSVPVRNTSTVSLTARNAGTAAAVVNSIASSNPVFSADPQSFTLAPGATTTLNVRFAPVAEGPQQGVLTLNMVGGLVAGLSVSGTGIAATGGGGGGGTTPAPTNDPNVLKLDDADFELTTGFNQGGIQGYFVNRLTPASYPATLRKVIVLFPPPGGDTRGLPLGSAVQIVSAATTASGEQINGPALTRTAATVTASDTFLEFDVPALTISSGSFLVGFTVLNPPNVFPAAFDTSQTSARRAYVSSDGAAFFLVDTLPGLEPGAFGIRARVEYGGASTPPATSTRIAGGITVAGWPNGRTSNNLPANAIDGNTATFTWTTEAFASAAPSYLGLGFAGPTAVNRIRLFKDADAGGPGLVSKNLVIEYTTSPVSTPLASRSWIPVTGLANGFQGTELLTATAVNANGTVSADSHNSLSSGWASLGFTPVNATGIRIGFSNTTTLQQNHYRVYEIEAYR